MVLHECCWGVGAHTGCAGKVAWSNVHGGMEGAWCCIALTCCKAPGTINGGDMHAQRCEGKVAWMECMMEGMMECMMEQRGTHGWTGAIICTHALQAPGAVVTCMHRGGQARLHGWGVHDEVRMIE